jgi:HK97 family phage prohead protease
MQPNELDRENYDSFLIPQSSSQSSEDQEDEPSAIETVDADGKRQLIGYAVVWSAISGVRRDGFRHQFFRGSITWSQSVYALWSHDISTPLASTINNTLTITEDDHGVLVTIDLDATTDGNNAFERVKNRLAYDRTDDPKIIKVTAFIADDVSLTIIPAMAETTIVTAANSDDLQKSLQATKESNMRTQKDHLDRLKLAQLRR